MQYRRVFVPGATFFFTVVTAGRRPLFGDAAACDVLRQALRRVAEQRPFTINAIVVLPDHLHCLWTLPPGDADYPTRWRLIKTRVTRGCGAKGSRWQSRYWEHLIRDDDDYRQHVEYIHYNPVKHGYVARPSEWPYSSFRRYVAEGLYPEDWGSTEPVWTGDVGRE